MSQPQTVVFKIFEDSAAVLIPPNMTYNFDFGFYAVQSLESTNPGGHAGIRTIYSPVETGTGVELGNSTNIVIILRLL